MPRPLPQAHADLAADPALLSILRACADPVRLRILRLLAEDAFGVQELCRMLELGQPNLSHHLKLLSEAGMLQAHRDGTHTFYRRALLATERPEAPVQQSLFTALDAEDLPAGLQQRRAEVFEARAERSRAFFTRHADAFDRNRDLIAAPEHYLPVLAKLLPEHAERALEIGPGPGEFLTELAARFTEVVAFDTSADMLERARKRCQEAVLDNVVLIGGELPDAGCRDSQQRGTVGADLSASVVCGQVRSHGVLHVSCDGREGLADAHLAPRFDTVVCAMVLHHAPDPAALLTRCTTWLRPGGSLLVAELCPHTQDWVADACGDVWRGFDPEQLSGWANAAGLTDDARQFLAQRNGFRIQLRRFVANHTLTAPRHPRR